MFIIICASKEADRFSCDGAHVSTWNAFFYAFWLHVCLCAFICWSTKFLFSIWLCSPWAVSWTCFRFCGIVLEGWNSRCVQAGKWPLEWSPVLLLTLVLPFCPTNEHTCIHTNTQIHLYGTLPHLLALLQSARLQNKGGMFRPVTIPQLSIWWRRARDNPARPYQWQGSHFHIQALVADKTSPW